MSSKRENHGVHEKSHKKNAKSKLAKKLSGVYTFGSDKFNSIKNKENSKETHTHSAKGESASRKVPQFFAKTAASIKSTAEQIKENPGSVVPLEKLVGDGTNPNSFSSVFNTDHEHIQGIKRVFRKSISFLILSLLSFGALTLVTVYPFGTNPLLTLVLALAYIITSNIFFIILADRSYLALNLIGQVFLFLVVNSFIGQAFTMVTIFGIILITFLCYLAYAELEKIQLGSRLFAINQIASESTKILWSVIFLIISLGLFNHTTHIGTIEAFDKYVIENEMVFEGIVLGESTGIPLNRFFVNEGLLNEKNELKFSGFLAANYQDGQPVVSASEQDEIILECENEKGIDNCGDAVLEERMNRLNRYKNEFYYDLGFELDTVLDDEKLNQVLKQYYRNSWAEFAVSDDSNASGELARILNLIPSGLLIDRTDVLPAGLAVILFVVLMLFRWLFMILSSIALWIFWKLLVITKFARIEVETVEAEVVSI